MHGNPYILTKTLGKIKVIIGSHHGCHSGHYYHQNNSARRVKRTISRRRSPITKVQNTHHSSTKQIHPGIYKLLRTSISLCPRRFLPHKSTFRSLYVMPRSFLKHLISMACIEASSSMSLFIFNQYRTFRAHRLHFSTPRWLSCMISGISCCNDFSTTTRLPFSTTPFITVNSSQ